MGIKTGLFLNNEVTGREREDGGLSGKRKGHRDNREKIGTTARNREDEAEEMRSGGKGRHTETRSPRRELWKDLQGKIYQKGWLRGWPILRCGEFSRMI